MKRVALFLTVLIFSVWTLCAETWFVCAGSFSKYDNAKDRCTLLNDAGFDCFVGTAVKADGTKLYRVFFLDDVMLRDDARAKKDELSKADAIVKNGLKDLWICQAEMPVKGGDNIFLAKRKVEAVKEPEEVPSLIEVVSIPELTDVLEDLTIPEIPSIEEAVIPGISNSVISCISQLPDNPLYVVEDFLVVDYTNYENNPFYVTYGSDKVFDEMRKYKELSAGAFIEVKHASTDKYVEMMVLKAEEGLSDEFISEEVMYYWDSEDKIRETEFKVNYGKMISVLGSEKYGYSVCGVSEDSKMVIYVSAQDLSEAEMMEFLATSFNPSSEIIYTELLKSFLPVKLSGEK